MFTSWTINWNKRAITLLEVMITIIILSFGLTLIIRSFMMSLRASHLAKDYTIASLLIEEKMWELERVGSVEADLDEEGEFPEPNNKFKYRLETQKKTETEEAATLNNVKLTVSWQQANKSNSISVATLLGDEQE